MFSSLLLVMYQERNRWYTCLEEGSHFASDGVALIALFNARCHAWCFLGNASLDFRWTLSTNSLPDSPSLWTMSTINDAPR
eukprot:gene21539-biopygen942